MNMEKEIDEDFEYFKSMYTSKDFKSAAFQIQVLIFTAYNNITQTNEEVKSEVEKLLREWDKQGGTFSSESDMYNMISIIGAGLRSGLILSVDSLLN